MTSRPIFSSSFLRKKTTNITARYIHPSIKVVKVAALKSSVSFRVWNPQNAATSKLTRS